MTIALRFVHATSFCLDPTPFHFRATSCWCEWTRTRRHKTSLRLNTNRSRQGVLCRQIQRAREDAVRVRGLRGIEPIAPVRSNVFEEIRMFFLGHSPSDSALACFLFLLFLLACTFWRGLFTLTFTFRVRFRPGEASLVGRWIFQTRSTNTEHTPCLRRQRRPTTLCLPASDRII